MPEADFREIQRAFAAHLRNPDVNPAPSGIEDRRMAIYRRLFFNNVRQFLAQAFPVLHSLYGTDEWSALARDFFARHRATSPQFYQLAEEFLLYLEEEHCPGPADPPFLRELAHYEWVEMALALEDQPESDADPDGDLLTQCPVLNPCLRQLKYAWPVHQIGPEYQPCDAPAEPTFLVVFRKPDDDIGFLSINAPTAVLMEGMRIRPQCQGQQHLEHLAQQMGMDPVSVLSFGGEVLEDLRIRGVICGTRPYRALR